MWGIFFLNSLFNLIVFMKAEYKGKTCSQFPSVFVMQNTLFCIKLDFVRVEKTPVNHIKHSKNACRTISVYPLL